MPLVPLAIAFALVAVDYGVWDWALGSSHEVVALIAGLAMAPLVLAFAWLAALTLGSGALILGRRAAMRILRGRPAATTRLIQAPRAVARTRSTNARAADTERPHESVAA